ncbi:beta-1,4-xylanase [Belliella baltica DSM 15883]|uniref:endo-1,4-beta-xylanase n=1 Tax=Belliella baltica (strain DSM 15883 / CIP 108006 / LMG 21964 / BA134) TaxID=866536 RepID=I3Z663_BELBD|nr:endo-1,4-beta-xylanase [Belliella baltica]AFL84731.1 beta-1,4-xylanase [Belliella baltica DSM 15883]
MEKFKKFGLLALSVGMITACADLDPLEFDVEKPESIALQEEIDSYAPLRTLLDTVSYPNFKLGVAMPLTDYASTGLKYRFVNMNFNEFTPSTGMSHQDLIQNDGSINLVNAESFLEVAAQKNINVFGTSLISYTNQNSGYLNGLLSPLIVESPAFVNELNLDGLKSGEFNDWTASSGVSLEATEGMGNGVPAVKLEVGASVSAPNSVSFKSPDITVIPGKTYEVLAFIKSDGPGEARFTFEGLSENEPVLDWTASGTPSETFTTSISWKEIRFRVNSFEGDSFKFQLETGYNPSVTYYLDINNLYVYDIDGDAIVNNLVNGGDFETGEAWGGWGNNSERGVTPDGQGVGGEGRAFFVTNPSTTGGFWEVQTLYQLAEPVRNGETYNLSFWVKGTADGVIRLELQSPDYSSNGFGQVFVTQDWRLVNVYTTVTADDRDRLIFSYGEFAGTVYIDKVVLSNANASGGSTTIVEKTAQEKNSIISSQMERWLTDVVSATKTYIKARTVIDQPMDDNNPSELRSGIGRTLGGGEFYWQDYVGKEYGVKAFQLARQNGNPDDILFINESGLEANLDKCQGLIDYVTYLENNGAQVDGIGTRMQLNLNSSTSNIATMFQMLAATGKRIRISGLEVRLMTTQPTQTMLERQAQIYEEVVGLYEQHVPASQRYGITLGSAIDSESDNSLRQGLWDTSLKRKPSYAGFANGLINK